MKQGKPPPSKKERVRTEQDYRERHQFWAGQTLTQFGTANNFFIIVGVAMLGYFLKELDEIGNLILCPNENKFATLLAIPAISTFLSILCGSITLLSRLYDLRLTRHINTVRIKGYKEKNSFKTFNGDYIDIREKSNYLEYALRLFWKFIGTLTKREYYLIDKDISGTEADSRFLELRERTLMLGSFSWMNFGWQIFWISMGTISYILIR